MTFFRSTLLFFPAAILMAQTPPKPAQAASPAAPPASMVQTAPPSQTPLVVPPDQVIIKVGNETITAAQFNYIVDSLPEQSRAQAKGPGRRQFADYLVRIMALAQEARQRKLDETDRYKFMARFQGENSLAGIVYEQITQSAKPDEAMLRKYYDEHKAEFEQVKARHILIRFQGSQVPVKPGEKDLSDAEALAKVQEIRKRVVGGEDFAKIAETESDDAGSGAKGGDLGSFGHNQMVPSFEQAAFALKPGELSEPVKTQFGYHLIKCEGRTEKTFDEVKPDLERVVGPQNLQAAVDDVVKKAQVTLDPAFFPPAK